MTLSDRLVALGFSRWVGVRQLPRLDADRESNVPGLHVVGDLADAPVIKLALAQGEETGRHLARLLADRPVEDGVTDVVIIGAGPAGVTAAMALAAAGRSYVLLERDAPFATIHRFPMGKRIFADPEALPTVGGLWFEHAPKEVLVERWRQALEERQLEVVQEEVTGLDGSDGQFIVRTRSGTPYRCRKVVLAIGRRGSIRALDVPGADLPHVHTELVDPAAFAGQDVLVIGGGDSAVETAAEIADAGGRVTLSYRKHALTRPKPKNKARIDALIERGALTFVPDSEPMRFTPTEATLRTPEGERTVAAEAVFPMVGTSLPVPFLRSLGLRMESDVDWARWAWVLGFVALVWAFYLVKLHKSYFPFDRPPLDQVHDWLQVPLPWYPTADGATKVLDGGFFGSLVYTALILGFGWQARKRWTSPVQQRRYLQLMGFQLFFLFGIPELVAPLITATPWKFYALSVPWPLSVWSLAHEPAAWMWMGLGALTSFVLVPLYVWRNNEKFCSYLCGCGGLAETLGDRWRHLAPRGALAKKAEWLGLVVLLAAIPTTGLLINDLWQLVGMRTWLEQPVALDGSLTPVESPDREGQLRISKAERRDGELVVSVQKFDWDGAWHDNGWVGHVSAGDAQLWPERSAPGQYTLDLAQVPEGVEQLTFVSASSSLSSATAFARHWYGLIVDFWLAAVLGVALYPMLGNRVWCRFFCPLRAYMELLAKRIGRLAIRPDDTCISCGECTRFCQMGIDVQGFAQQQVSFDNAVSACIQCGICVEVCPVDCLELVDVTAAAGRAP